MRRLEGDEGVEKSLLSGFEGTEGRRAKNRRAKNRRAKNRRAKNRRAKNRRANLEDEPARTGSPSTFDAFDARKLEDESVRPGSSFDVRRRRCPKTRRRISKARIL